jgi:feruloyl esterase
VKAKALIQANYGTAPRLSYFNGCSQGGRQGITSAQRYPTDFDGIVAGAPAWGGMRLYAGRLTLNHIVNKTPDAVIPPGKYPLIHKAVMNACDARDGVTDGVIENPTTCRFDPQVLACKGEDTTECLTPGQIASARAMISPIKNPATGEVIFEGHLWPGAELEWDVLGGPQLNNNVATVFRNLVAADPKWDPKTFNPATDVARAMKAEGHQWMLSDDANLKPYFDRGGKLLMYHGWADPQVPAHTATMYYSNVLKTVGPQATNSMALFMVPGMLHCNGGAGTDTFDKVAALEAWVERAQKPTRIVASHLTDGKVDKTRPLCPFGQVAKWNGKGDTNDAANFACVAE